MAHMGNKSSPESRAKISAALMGKPSHPQSLATRAKMSISHMGHLVSFEERKKLSIYFWKGGAPVYNRKRNARRSALGFNPLNSFFVGSEAHHINQSDIIYIPKAMHRSIYHRQDTGKGMAEMNALAGQFLAEDRT